MVLVLSGNQAETRAFVDGTRSVDSDRRPLDRYREEEYMADDVFTPDGSRRVGARTMPNPDAPFASRLAPV